jgi:hypothetical protein
MKQIIFIILLITISFAANSQHEDYYISPDTANVLFEEHNNDRTPFSQKKKLSLGVNIGTSYSSYGNGIFTSYTAPEIRYRASEKFTITVGTMASFSSFNGAMYNPENSNIDYAGRIAQYYTYASGSYQVNERFRIRAGGVYELTPNTNYNSYKSGHIGFDFQLSENTFINADVQFSNGYYSPAMYFSNGGVFGNPDRFNNYMNPYRPNMGW